MEKDHNSLDDVCRVCANKIKDKHRQRHMFNYLRGKLLLNLKIITGVELAQKNELPNFICQRCISELDLAIKFRERCIFSQNYLEVMLKKNRKEVGDKELYEDLVDEEQLEYIGDEVQVIESSDVVDDTDDQTDDVSEDSTFHEPTEYEYDDEDTAEEQPKAEKRHFVLLEESRPAKRVRNFFICEECGEYFNHEGDYTEHLNGHMEHKKAKHFFPCWQCTASFKTNRMLKFHRQQEHNNGRIFKCGTCSETFLEHSAKQRHEIAHVNERPYPCLECELEFKNVEDLRMHSTMTHAHPKFRCEPCNLDLSSRKRLDAHSKTNRHKLCVQQMQEEMDMLSGEEQPESEEYSSS